MTGREVGSRRWGCAALVAGRGLLVAPQAAGNIGVPMLALLWPVSVVAFVPVVAVEAVVARRVVGGSWGAAWKLSFLACRRRSLACRDLDRDRRTRSSRCRRSGGPRRGAGSRMGSVPSGGDLESARGEEEDGGRVADALVAAGAHVEPRQSATPGWRREGLRDRCRGRLGLAAWRRPQGLR